MTEAMNVDYKTGLIPAIDEIIRVYDDSGLNRPTSDHERIAQMYAESNLIVSAWIGERLVGVARGLTDFCYACYLSDLAVDKNYQKSGIGKGLIGQVKAEIGERTALILLSAATAMEYYPKVGFEKIDNGFVIKRKR